MSVCPSKYLNFLLYFNVLLLMNIKHANFLVAQVLKTKLSNPCEGVAKRRFLNLMNPSPPLKIYFIIYILQYS